MTCDACKKLIEKRVKKIAEVSDAEVSLQAGELCVTADQPITKEAVSQVLTGTDYSVN